MRDARRGAAQRYLGGPARAVQIVVARIGGQVAEYAVLRIEPTGVAYLRTAMTVAAFRGRGVYQSLVAHRVALARAAGCSAAAVQAMTSTSAPILRRRGIRPVCQLAAFAAQATSVLSPTA